MGDSHGRVAVDSISSSAGAGQSYSYYRFAIDQQQHQHMGMACGFGSECQSSPGMALIVDELLTYWHRPVLKGGHMSQHVQRCQDGDDTCMLEVSQAAL